MNRRQFLTAVASGLGGCEAVGRGADDHAANVTGTGAPMTRTGQSTPTGESTEMGTADGEPIRIAEPGASVGLEPVASGLRWPVDLVTPADRPERSYVLSRHGEVLVLDRATGRTTVALDLFTRLAEPASWEMGLLGAALHPEFSTNRRLFVRYSGRLRPGMPDGYSHAFVLSEFRASESGLTIDPSTERIVLEIPEPGPIHNAGGLAFGPDGYLYVGVGDGGGGHYDRGPGHVADWYEPVAGGNGQDVAANLLGSVLRIDVDGRSTSTRRTGADDRDGESSGEPGGRGAGAADYAVPAENPLVGESGLNEHFAWGLRNPYRLAFWDGDLLVGDVGQDSYEEVNVVEMGGNYGWNVREGPGCVKRSTCPTESARGEPLLDPVLWYAHRGSGTGPTSVVGGVPYADGAVAAIAGTYVFGDLYTGRHGHLFAATPPDAGSDGWRIEELVVADEPDGLLRDAVLGFGTDADGEVYVLTTRFRERSGAVHRIAPAG